MYLNGVQKENVTVFHIFWFALCLLFNTQLGLIGSNEKGRRVKLRIARNCIIPVLLVRPSFLVATFHDLTAKVTCSSYYAWKLNWVFGANCWSGDEWHRWLCPSKCITDDSLQTMAFTGTTHFTLLLVSPALRSRDFLSRGWVKWFCGFSFHRVVFEARRFRIDRMIGKEFATHTFLLTFGIELCLKNYFVPSSKYFPSPCYENR